MRLLNDYFRLLDHSLGQLLGSGGKRLEFRVRDDSSIDERLTKIEAARENLQEGLAALDELKSQADENRRALEEALQTIAELDDQKSQAKKELETLRSVAELDAGALKKLFDVPTPGRIWRERFYGLLTGIFASVVASFLWSQLSGK